MGLAIRNQVIHFAAKMFRDFDCGCQCGAAAVFPALGVSLT